MDTVEMRLIFWLSNFWIKAVTMATSYLMTGRYIPNFGLNSLISTLSFGEIVCPRRVFGPLEEAP